MRSAICAASSQRGRQDEGANSPVARLIREVLQDGQHERRRLSRTRLGAGEHVAAGDHVRNHLGLHRRGLRIALVEEGADERRDEAELGERRRLDGRGDLRRHRRGRGDGRGVLDGALMVVRCGEARPAVGASAFCVVAVAAGSAIDWTAPGAPGTKRNSRWDTRLSRRQAPMMGASMPLHCCRRGREATRPIGRAHHVFVTGANRRAR